MKLLKLRTEKCLSNIWRRIIPEFIAETQVATWCCSVFSDDLTWLQLCNKEHDFLFVFWRMVMRSSERWDAELGFVKLLRACKC